jgi:hypothetical protein
MREKTMTRITIENASNFPVGTEVEFNWGAYSAPVQGFVTRVEFVPATKFFPADARLWAEYIDDDGETVETTVTQFSDIGIGTRLVRVATAAAPIKSKWAA